MTHHADSTKTAIDIMSVFTAFGAFFQVLPAIAALFSIIWTGMRIIEMVTGKQINELLTRKKNDN